MPVKTGDKLKLAMARAQMPEPTMDEVLQDRKQIHGDFSLDAGMAQRLKTLLRDGENWSKLSSVEREALEMICTKLGRIMVGNHRHKDHWDDVAGYARLVSQRLA